MKTQIYLNIILNKKIKFILTQKETIGSEHIRNLGISILLYCVNNILVIKKWLSSEEVYNTAIIARFICFKIVEEIINIVRFHQFSIKLDTTIITPLIAGIRHNQVYYYSFFHIFIRIAYFDYSNNQEKYEYILQDHPG